MRILLAHISAESQARKNEVRVTIAHPDLRQDGVYVPTTIERSGNPPVRVTWVVRADALNPRLIDVIAEGVSLRLTVRNDYSAFLLHHGNNIDSLLEAMRNQTCDDCAPAISSDVR
jgi:phospholipid transport system substrate-binding protein